MTCEEIYQELMHRQVKIFVNGDLLSFTAPPGALTPQLIASMKRCKQDLIKLVKAQVAADETTVHTFEATYGQEALWLLNRANPSSAAYNTAATLRILSPLCVDSLRIALNKLQSRHELLRSTFVQREGGLKVDVQTQPTLDFRVIDASELDEDALLKLVQSEYAIPFDLQAGSPHRARLFHQAADRHVLLLIFHHIIFDAFSLWILQKELQQLYEAESTGQVCLLPILSSQFSDFAKWQRALVEREEGKKQWEFWKTQLEGDPVPAELPWTFARNRLGERRGATHGFQIDEQLSSAVRQLAKSLGATPFATLMAALQTLIYRYSGLQDFVLGTTTNGRSQRQFDQNIGYFVNILPIRSQLSGQTLFQELVQQTKQRLLGAMQAGDFPFSLLVNRLNPVRASNAPPLCRMMFGLQKPQGATEVGQLFEDAEETIEWGGLKAQAYQLDQQEGQFDLTFEVYDSPKLFSALIKYDRKLLSDDAARRLGHHFIQLLRSVIANPSRPIADYEYISPVEREQLSAWSFGTSMPPPAWLRYDECFDAAVAHHPESTAMSFGAQRWTYSDLQAWSSIVARRFQELGVQPGDKVVVCLQRRPMASVCLLAALKCGAAFVPVAPDSPTKRLEIILKECQPRLVITESRRRETIEDLAASTTLVVPHETLEWGQIKAGKGTSSSPTNALKPAFAPETIAYIIYTSGSSGVPKAVMVSHRALCWHVSSMASVYAMTNADRVLQFSEMTFDPSLEQLLLPWSLGAAVVVRPDTMYSGSGFWREVANERITVANVPPSFFTECSQYVQAGTNLRMLIVGGDQFPNTMLPKWSQSSVRLLNAYGPTEGVITATTCDVTERDPSQSIPIGRPKPGSRVLVLDQHKNLVATGVPGELCLGGPMLAEGYLGEAVEGSRPFEYLSLDGQTPEQIYRTGDLARWTSDGQLEFLGRLDRQIKIRGFRVEPGEIEVSLLDHPGVRQAFVLLREEGAHQFLAAHIVPKPRCELTRESLIRHLKTCLPLYMIPERFGFLEALPLNDSGKIAVDLLPDLPRPTVVTNESYVAPRNDLEQIMARIWAEVLEVKSVGIHDDFLALGGGSLQSLRIISRMNDAGISLIKNKGELEPHLLFQFGSIAELSPMLQLSQQSSEMRSNLGYSNQMLGSQDQAGSSVTIP